MQPSTAHLHICMYVSVERLNVCISREIDILVSISFKSLTHFISIPQLLVEKSVIIRFFIKENNYHYIGIR